MIYPETWSDISLFAELMSAKTRLGITQKLKQAAEWIVDEHSAKFGRLEPCFATVMVLGRACTF